MENRILKLMNNRSSFRNFLEQEIPQEIMDRILECTTKAPSTSGFQNYSIIVVKNREKLKHLSEYAMKQKFIEKAPAAIVFCIDLAREHTIIKKRPTPWKEDYNFVNLLTKNMDVAIAAQTLCLAAEEEGLRSIFIANILNHLQEVSSLLELPNRVIPSLMVIIGYGKGKNNISPKYDKHVLVHNEYYHVAKEKDIVASFDEKYQNWNMKPTKKILGEIIATAEEYEGQSYASCCRKEIEEAGIVNPYQFYYGYWYQQEKNSVDRKKYSEFLTSKKLFWLE